MSTKKFVARHGLDANFNTISNVADPVNSGDVATKNITDEISIRAGSAFNAANNGISIAQSAFDAANNVAPQIEPAFSQANSAFNAANTVSSDLSANLSLISGINSSQNTNIGNLSSWLSSNNSLQSGINAAQNTSISLIQGVDNTQNTNISNLNAWLSSNVSLIQGVDATQNTNISNLNTWLSSNVSLIQGVDATQNTNIDNLNTWLSSNNTLQSGINTTQNTNIGNLNTWLSSNVSLIAGVDTTQNTNISNLNTWLSSNNTLQSGINATQNTNISIIQGVDATQNTNISNLNTWLSSNNTLQSGINATQNTRIDSAYTHANSSFNVANTKFNSSGGVISGSVEISSNLLITGNLTISGNVTTVSANNLVIQDNMIYLNDSAEITLNPDLGIAGAYNDGTYHHTGFFRDATDGVWKVYDNYLPEPDQSPYIDTSNSSFRIANFQANNITANTLSGTANNSSYLNGYNSSYFAPLSSLNSEISLQTGVNATQNTNISNLNAWLNSNNSIQSGINATQNTRIDSAFTQANTANINSANASFLSTGTVPVARLSSIPNSSLLNSSLTINGTSISLGGSGTVTAAAGTLTGSTLASGVTGSSLTSVGTITSGTWSGSFGAVSGANLTGLTAGNLSGTIPSAVLGNSTHYVGTTAIALNRASGSQTLTGVSIDGNAATATALQTARTISLSGDASGSISFDGSANVSITTSVADDSHNHIISNVDGLQTALDTKAPLASPALTGTPTAPTAANTTNSTQIATTAFVKNAVANLVDSSPTTLDTLNELAAALGDDPNFATTVSTSIGTKLPSASFTGANVLSLIVSVDGAGSNLDADLLDGQQGSYYTNASNLSSGTVPVARLSSIPNSSLANTSVTVNGTAISLGSSGTVTAAAGTLTGSTLASGVTASSLTSVGTITSGTWSGSFGAVSGANLTELTAGNLSGTIPSGVLGNSSLYVGTTAIALNRASSSQTLTGVSIDGSAGSVAWGNVSSKPSTLSGYGITDWTSTGMPNNTDAYVNLRVVGNYNSSSSNDGMYIGYSNSNSGVTRIFGGGVTTGEFVKYASYSTEPGSFRAPLFYDSNNTGYYIDPASTSNINSMQMAGPLYMYSGSYEGSILFGSNSTWRCGIRQHDDADAELRIWAKNSSGMIFLTTGYDGEPASISRPTNGLVVQNNNVGIGNFSSSDPLYDLHIADGGIGYATGSFRAPIFYDSDNTGYYINPASTSVLNQVNLNGILLRSAAATGWLSGNYTGSETGSTTGAIYSIGGSYYPTSTSLNNMYGVGYCVAGSVTGVSGFGSGWGFYASSGGTARHFLDSDNGVAYASASHRSPIFYDYNDTGYYVDPNSTSNIYGLTVNQTITGSVSGNSTSVGNVGISNICSGNNGTATSDTVSDMNSTTAKSGFYLYNNPTNAPTATWQTWMNVSGHYSGDRYGWQLSHGYWDNDLWVRGVNSNSWRLWRKILDSNNYTSYAMPTGSSATNSVDVRAPIFYDSNDTAYYIDPNSNSKVSNLYSTAWIRSYGTQGIYNQDYGVHFYGQDSEGYCVTGSGGIVKIIFRSNHQSTVRGYVYGDTSNNFGFLNNEGSWRLRIVGGDYSLADGSSMRAQLYYDSNDTGYYVNPNDVSQFWRVNASNYVYSSNQSYSTIHYDTNDSGYYIDPNSTSNLNYAVVRGLRFTGVGGDSGNGSVYDSYAIYQQGGSWTHPYPDLCIGYHTGIKIGAYYGYNGTRFYNNSDWATQIFSVGDGDNNVRVLSDIRSPIFYDYNDTGYYLDANSTSRFARINQNANEWNYSHEGWQRLYYQHGDGTIYKGGTTSQWTHLFRNHDDGTRWLMAHSGDFYASGNITAYWSDRRLKKNIEKISDWKNILDNINGYRFQWNDIGKKVMGNESDDIEVGLIAQEVNDVFPQAAAIQMLQYKDNVNGTLIPKDDINYDPENPYLTVREEKLIPVLVEALKSHEEEIEKLKLKIQKLENIVQYI